ncbi:cation/H(+) antiporter [Amycolatopsis antarctica]|uniref:Cation/H(+) antiporter n=1 Tax=Amycolatopsis antarctica TaxID=1854586 RepID=A0A263D1C2_9PSEU|nr:cation:proton antiporter [Amycolatopsis antarctica]OZM71908.1 cation/H(+) antiporter [Amycolatopsis antarctica]
MTPAPVPPLGTHSLLVFLLQVGALLLAGVVLGRLAKRLGMPALVGELLAGVLLGPTILGNLAPQLGAWLFPQDPAQTHLLDAFSQVGVLLLVGITGAHLDSSVFRKHGGRAMWISVCGLVVPLGCGFATGYVVPDSLVPDGVGRGVFALFLGVAMCVTAIPVIAKILLELDLMHRKVGQLTVAAAFFDDTVGWLLLSVVAALATGGAAGATLPQTLGYLVVFLAAAFLIGRPVVRRALRASSRHAEAGPTVAVAVVTILAYSAATAAIGLEALFGAFVAGATVLGFADPAKLAPLRTIVLAVLAPVFLAGIGLRMDITLLAEPTVLLTAIAVLLVAILGKFGGVYLGARAGRLSHTEGIALGVAMNARGMIEVVIALAGLRIGVLNTATFTIIVLVAIVTSLLAPPLLRLATRDLIPDAEEQQRRIRFAGWSAADGPGLNDTARAAR